MGIDCNTMDLHEAVYTWIDPDGVDTVLHFASDRMAAWAKDNLETVMTPCNEADARMLIRDRCLEKHRLDRFDLKVLDLPVLYCEMDGGTHLLVDGNHRYVYAAALGVPWIKAHIFKRSDWEPFLVDGLGAATEEQLRASPSGL